MAPYQTSTPSSQPHLAKTSILGIIFFLLGAPHIYGFFNPPLKEGGNTMIPRFITLVLTAGAVASLIEWLILRSTGMV